MQWIWLRRDWILIGAIAFCAIAVLLVNAYVRAVTRQRRVTQVSQVTPQPVAIVFGAGVWEDGTPTPMLADRVGAAVALYRVGRVESILMSGDSRTPHYDETGAMRRYAETRGVPSDRIFVDPAGLSTYESCDRAKTVYNIDRAVAITQRYHLPRAVYTCTRLGIDAVGFGVADWGIYQHNSMLYYSMREHLAVVKAVLQIDFRKSDRHSTRH
jgi:vancomycin permeability regulator SanA